MTFKSRKKEEINRQNLYFNTRLSPTKAERVFNVMALLGIENRAIAMNMAFECFIERFGKPLQ